MTPTDPEQANFIIKHTAEIVTGAAIVIIGILKFLGRQDKAEAASSILRESPVSHAELLKCQMRVNATIDTHFKELRTELMAEIKELHQKVNTHVSDHHKTAGIN